MDFIPTFIWGKEIFSLPVLMTVSATAQKFWKSAENRNPHLSPKSISYAVNNNLEGHIPTFVIIKAHCTNKKCDFTVKVYYYCFHYLLSVLLCARVRFWVLQCIPDGVMLVGETGITANHQAGRRKQSCLTFLGWILECFMHVVNFPFHCTNCHWNLLRYRA